MVDEVLRNLANISASVNVISALLILWMMQKVTSDAGFGDHIAVLKLVHRAALCALSTWLMIDAGYSIDDQSTPRMVDLILQVFFLVVIMASFLRHIAAPRKVPCGNTVFNLAKPAAG